MTHFDRRSWLRAAGAGMFGLSASGFMPRIANAAAGATGKRRHCILLWMSGGPSQTDTFDMKPGHENGGEFKEIATNAPGVRFSEHLPKLAANHADKMAIIRSLSTKEGDHARGTTFMRTGHKPMGPIRYPAIGASLGKELGRAEDAMPPYVSVAPYLALSAEAHGPGFLGPKFAPLVVNGGGAGFASTALGAVTGQQSGFAQLKVDAITPPPGVTQAQMDSRLELWRSLQNEFLSRRPGNVTEAHQTVYHNALRMIESDASDAFNLDKEPTTVRERYGRGVFGQGCLLARRLVERGVPFVEVTLGSGAGWDTHSDIFNQVGALSKELDDGWSTLMAELEERGLLESTTILWMGEFGRTPKINGSTGRDHFPQAWSCVLAGGGIAGGQTYGRTSAGGTRVEERPVSAPDVLATLCEAVGVPPDTYNDSNTGRPIQIVDGYPIDQLLS